MKKKIIAMVCFCLLLTGCGSNPKSKNANDVVVSFKDGTKITVDELYTNLKERYGINVLLNNIYTIVLEKEFDSYKEDALEKAKSTVEYYSQMYGGDDKLLEALTSYGYGSIEDFTNQYYLSYLEDKAILEYAKTKVSDKEIKNYYKNDVYGDVNIKHILITPTVTEDLSDEEIKKAETEAKDQVTSIIEELKSAKDVKAKFEELAKKYSQDDDTAEDGGDLGYINYGTLSESYDELIDSALKLKNGEFSTSIITTELGYHIIYRVDQKEKASLEDSKDQIIETLAKKMASDDTTISGKALQYYCEKNELDIKDDYLHSQYAKVVQNSLTEQTDKN